MSKVICDVCGTDYPETAAQCPICGCARADGAQTSAGNTVAGEEERAYTYVKGGRFSKSNVRKRLKESQKQEPPVEESNLVYDDDDEDDDDDQGVITTNKGLVILMVLLLLAVVAVGSFIAIEYFGLGGNPAIPTGTTGSVLDVTDDTNATGQIQVPCTDLVLSDSDIELKTVNSTWQLEGTVAPADTTDIMKFASSDESVAIVDANGLITAVGNGEATIRVTCGKITKECQVVCNFEGASNVTTEPTGTGDPTDPTDTTEDVELKLNREDFSLFSKGASWKVYSGELDPAKITWTSGNEDVVTVENGLVVAVGPGRTRVYAEYNGQKASCWVSCSFKVEEETEPTEGTDPTEGTEPTEPAQVYSLMVNGHISPYGDEYNAEVSILVGESFSLTVEDSMGARMNVEWAMSADGICTVDGRKVEGASAGNVKLTCEYEGKTYTCLIHVNNIPEQETTE